ncbi:MAG: hypothetical protein MUF49_11205 [Oculatellaceae cyanobacterium Prado106]|jgi:hypothetical protein|nr:hypothetical protein [Oculatellaceae cyanobacterium Prado106]
MLQPEIYSTPSLSESDSVKSDPIQSDPIKSDRSESNRSPNQASPNQASPNKSKSAQSKSNSSEIAAPSAHSQESASTEPDFPNDEPANELLDDSSLNTVLDMLAVIDSLEELRLLETLTEPQKRQVWELTPQDVKIRLKQIRATANPAHGPPSEPAVSQVHLTDSPPSDSSGADSTGGVAIAPKSHSKPFSEHPSASHSATISENTLKQPPEPLEEQPPAKQTLGSTQEIHESPVHEGFSLFQDEELADEPDPPELTESEFAAFDQETSDRLRSIDSFLTIPLDEPQPEVGDWVVLKSEPHLSTAELKAIWQVVEIQGKQVWVKAKGLSEGHYPMSLVVVYPKK